MGKKSIWKQLAAGGLVAAATWGGTMVHGAPYQYPVDIPKSAMFDIESVSGVMQHDNRIQTGKISGKIFEETDSFSTLEYHFRDTDGSEVVKKSDGWSSSSRGMNQRRPDYAYAIESIPFANAQVGDVYLGYVSCVRRGQSWIGNEFALQCGGKGSHAKCNKCFKLISVISAKRLLENRPVRVAEPSQEDGSGSGEASPSEDDPFGENGQGDDSDEDDFGEGSPPAAPFAADDDWDSFVEPSSAVANPAADDDWASRWGDDASGGTSSESVQGGFPKFLKLDKNLAVYSVTALPREEKSGTLRAGTPLYVMEEVDGTFVRIRFSTSSGKNYEGAAKLSDLTGR